ncbi:MAG: hypothetical protein J5980_12000, partial [Muribaculaceae bacterium]|nr:hypothetical protein [Muribaculaceae bacterium]
RLHSAKLERARLCARWHEIWITSAALGKARASSALRSLARDLDNLEVSAKERMYYVFGGLWWLLVVLVVNIFHQKCD